MYKVLDDGSIEMIRGDTASFDISAIVEGTGEEYELGDDDQLVFTVKKNIKSSDVLIQKTGTHIVIEPADTSGLPYGRYKYDVQLTLADGSVDTIVPPTNFILDGEVTW